MSDDFKRRMRACFDKADSDKSGALSIKEVQKVMQDCGCKLSDKEIATLFCNDDSNNDFKISFDEFWASCSKRDPKTVKEEELRATFKDLDVDGSGCLTASDMKQCLSKAGITDEESVAMIAEFDTNKDGKVNFEEFLDMWRSKLN